MVVLWDLNARVGNEVIEGRVGRHGVPGRNESGERLPEMCAEQELVVGNSWFKKIDVSKYTWLRMAEGRVVDKALMDYVLLPRRKKLRGERKTETNASTLVGVTSHVTISAKIHCK